MITIDFAAITPTKPTCHIGLCPNNAENGQRGRWGGPLEGVVDEEA